MKKLKKNKKKVNQNEIDELTAEAEESDSSPTKQQEQQENEEEDQDDQEEGQEDQEDETAAEPRCSTRQREQVEQLIPTMKGKSYLQAAKKGMNEQDKLEHCHNLTAQVSPNPDEDWKHATDEAMLTARTMNEFNERAQVQGASFAQQCVLKKGLQKFGE